MLAGAARLLLVMTFGFVLSGNPGTNFCFLHDPLGESGVTSTPWFSYEYYDIDGKNEAELAKSLTDNGPRDSVGRLNFARLNWDVRWNFRKSDEILYSARLIFPRLRAPENSNEEILLLWEKMTRAMVEHELHHRDLVQRHAELLRERVAWARTFKLDIDPEILGLAAAATLKTLRRENEQYDAITADGSKQGIFRIGRGNESFVR